MAMVEMPWWGFALLLVGGIMIGLALGVLILRHYFKDMM